MKTVFIVLALAIVAAATGGCESLSTSQTDTKPSETGDSQSAPPTVLNDVCPSASAAGNSGGDGVWCLESNGERRKFQFGDLHAFVVRLDHDGDDAYQLRINFPELVTSESNADEQKTSQTIATLDLRTQPFNSLTDSEVRGALQHGLRVKLQTSPFDSEAIPLPSSEHWDAGEQTSRVTAQLRAFNTPDTCDGDPSEVSCGEFAMTATFEYPSGGFAAPEPPTIHVGIQTDDLAVVDSRTAAGSFHGPEDSTHPLTGAWATHEPRDHHLTLHYSSQTETSTTWQTTEFWQISTGHTVAGGTLDVDPRNALGEVSYRTTLGHPLTAPWWPKSEQDIRWPTGPAPDTPPISAKISWPSDDTVSVRNGRYCESKASSCRPNSLADLPVEFDFRRVPVLCLDTLEPLDVADGFRKPSNDSEIDGAQTTETSLPSESTASIAIHRETQSTRVLFDKVWAQSRPFPFNGPAASAWQQINSDTGSTVPSSRQLVVELPPVTGASDQKPPKARYTLEVRRFDSDRRQFPARLIPAEQCDPSKMPACLGNSNARRGLVGTFLLEAIDRTDRLSTLTGKFRSDRRRDQPQIEVQLDGIEVSEKQLDGLQTSWVYRLKSDVRYQLPSGWITLEPSREIISVYAQRITSDSQARGHHVYKLENDSPGLQTGAYVTDIKWTQDETPIERATVVVLRELDGRIVELAEYWLDGSGAAHLGIDAEGPIELNASNLHELGTQMAEFTTDAAWRRPTLSSPVTVGDFQ